MYRALRVLFVLALMAPAPGFAQTGEVQLAWDAPSDPAVTGYIIDFGVATGVYAQSINVGLKTDHTIQGLVPGQRYYFAVRSYDENGTTSTYSNEISHTITGSSTTPTFPTPTDGPAFGDVRTELIWRHSTSGAIARWQMSGRNQLWGEAVGPGAIDTAWRIAGTGDFNADGHRDLLWQHTDGWVAVWLMRGQTLMAGWSLQPDRVADTDWQIVAVADIDRDNRPDILWQHETTGAVSVWYMNGTVLRDGRLLTGAQGIGADWKVVGVGDFNGDLSQDLLWRHQTTGAMAMWFLNRDQQLFGAQLNPNAVADFDWQVATIADMNGDSMADIVWQHTDGRLAVWTMRSWNMMASLTLTPNAIGDASWRIVTGR